jgi:hypothetical protein
MRDKVIGILARNGTIAAGLLCAWLYRLHSRGDALFTRRVLYGVVMVFVTFMLASAWQATSKVERWSWFTTLLAFVATLMVVNIATVVGIYGIVGGAIR